MVDDLFINQIYYLYRGVVVLKSEFENFKEGDFIDDSGISWTLDIGTAIRFANGKDNWMSSETLSKHEMGIVFSYKFDNKDILIDMDYVEKIENHSLSKIIDFPDEKEIITYPYKKKCKIVKIINE